MKKHEKHQDVARETVENVCECNADCGWSSGSSGKSGGGTVLAGYKSTRGKEVQFSAVLESMRILLSLISKTRASG